MQQKQVNTAARVQKATLLHFFFSVSDSNVEVVEIRHSLHLGSTVVSSVKSPFPTSTHSSVLYMCSGWFCKHWMNSVTG